VSKDPGEVDKGCLITGWVKHLIPGEEVDCLIERLAGVEFFGPDSMTS